MTLPSDDDPVYIVIDLGYTREIDYFAFAALADFHENVGDPCRILVSPTSGFENTLPVDYVIEYKKDISCVSPNVSTWEPLVSVENNVLSKRGHSLPRVKTNAVRLKITKCVNKAGEPAYPHFQWMNVYNHEVSFSDDLSPAGAFEMLAHPDRDEAGYFDAYDQHKARYHD